MSKSIDFFNELDKREKAMSDAIRFRNIEGFKTFYCELEKCWITPFACIKRQKKEIKFRKAAGFETFETKCDQCRQAKEIQKITGVKIKKEKKDNRKSIRHKRNNIPEKMVCKICGEEKNYKKHFKVSYNGVPYGFICNKCAAIRTAENSGTNY